MREENQCEPRVAFRRRRRRKRPRPTSADDGRQKQQKASVNDRSGEKQGAAEVVPENRATRMNGLPRSLPMLLNLRSTGSLRQRDLLLRCSLGKRSIRFSQLQSSNAEAVLALEQSGSYFVSLAGNMPHFTLALRLYGVPSPFMLEKAKTETTCVTCPLVSTIPLLCSSDEDADESASPVATTPVQVVISRDWSVGMTFVHHSSSSDSSRHVQEEELLGDLVLFSFSTSGDTVQSFRCSNVRVAGSRAFTMRNLLWETNTIPCGESAPTALCSKVLNLPGHLFLNDEEDGFRLTWVVSSEWAAVKDEHVEPLSPSRLSTTPSRHDIITKTDEVVWEENWSDRYSGRATTSSRARRTLDIAFEAYFSVDVLLHEILARRKEKFGYQNNALPDFHYNLISIDDNGRTAFLVIVFGRTVQSATKSRRLSVGVFLQIDILTQSFEEAGWVQNFAPSTSESLRKWSNVLALTRRMKDQRLGPFCTRCGQDKALGTYDWSMFHDDSSNNYDQSQDKDTAVWERYLDRLTLKEETSSLTRAAAPNCVSCASLFPTCDLITNVAVRMARPVPFIRCRGRTTEFVYG